MYILQVPLIGQINSAHLVLDIAMFIVAVIVMYNTNKRANEKAMGGKADNSRVDSVECNLSEKIRAIHHRVDGIEERNDASLRDIQKDIKTILKEMPRK